MSILQRAPILNLFLGVGGIIAGPCGCCKFGSRLTCGNIFQTLIDAAANTCFSLFSLSLHHSLSRSLTPSLTHTHKHTHIIQMHAAAQCKRIMMMMGWGEICRFQLLSSWRPSHTLTSCEEPRPGSAPGFHLHKAGPQVGSGATET